MSGSEIGAAAAGYAAGRLIDDNYRRQSTGGTRVRVQSTERSDSRSSPEAKAASAFLKAINTLSFDARGFVFPLAISSLPLRKRVLSILIGFIVMQCDKYDRGAWDSEEDMNFLIDCKRMQDALLPYSIANNEWVEYNN